jgi:tetratricopeptide (TPR) repeat protein
VNLVSRYCEVSQTGGKDPESLLMIEEGRVQNLLQGGDPAAAVRALEKIPEEARSPELWMKAGSAYSLSGNDERALVCFDRCSAATCDQELLTRCASEKGLSLRRLGRYEEAIALYENLIPRVGQEALFPVMGNYAGTLLDAGRIEDAVKRARWLVAKCRERPQAWGLLGQALRALGEFEEAAMCFERSIDRDPNGILAHLEAAEIYQFEFGDLEDALAHLNAAFATGEQNSVKSVEALSQVGRPKSQGDPGGRSKPKHRPDLLDASHQAHKGLGLKISPDPDSAPFAQQYFHKAAFWAIAASVSGNLYLHQPFGSFADSQRSRSPRHHCPLALLSSLVGSRVSGSGTNLRMERP